jgi:DNA-directed RNA polymerase specialized sigma24 family protein
MSELYTPGPELQRDWKLDAAAFDRLLHWLDGGFDSEGQKYIEMRRRLVAYFDRKNCSAPEELADETLNRVARRLHEEGITEAETPAKYCYIVARFVFMESVRRMQQEQKLRGELGWLAQSVSPATQEIDDRYERMLECMRTCIKSLDSGKQELILSYYTGKQRQKIENRKRFADRLGITTNALSIRACRIRDELENCVRQCLKTE